MSPFQNHNLIQKYMLDFFFNLGIRIRIIIQLVSMN